MKSFDWDVFLSHSSVNNQKPRVARLAERLERAGFRVWFHRPNIDNGEDIVAAIRVLTGGNGADVVFECAGGSPKQGLAGPQTLYQATEAVRSGGKIIGVSWFGGPVQLDVDLLRERSLRYLFPDISTQAHLEHTVRLVASGRVRLQPMITHVLSGINSVPQAFEITSNKGQFKAINPAQVMMHA